MAKGGDFMKIICFCSFLILFLSIFSILLNSNLQLSNRFTLFVYSLSIHIVLALYSICTFFEIFILHEKQGSKLTMTKSKIMSDWR